MSETHPTGDQLFPVRADFAGSAPEQNHFEAATVIEMNVSRGDDFFKMIMLKFGEAFADLACMMVVD